ncbi:cadherin repeat domain-containing protein, partial [Enterovibrio norvegicus]|uniref:cadherin repeat domain-containing protein n=2 Tax=Enterovibrio TaxID=188143 RepID=UPI0006826B22
MFAVSPEGELRVVSGRDFGNVGDVVVAFHDGNMLASNMSSNDIQSGSLATVFVLEESGPSPILTSPAEEAFDAIGSTFGFKNVDEMMAKTSPSSGENSEQISPDGSTRFPLSIIEGCLERGMWASEMAGFDTSGSGGLSAAQLALLEGMAPLSEVMDEDSGENTVSENAQIGDEVGITVAKEFADGHGDVIFTLVDDAGGLFAIDPDTGVVTVAGNLDYETATGYTIEVAATSEDNQVTTKTFTINITDSSPEEGDTDNALSSISAADGGQGSIFESATNGDSTGLFVSATDEDGDIVTYTLTDNANGAFAIDGETGEVTVVDSSLLDYETAQSQTIEVTATSTDGSTSTQTFTIALTDDNTEFSISSVSDSDTAANILSESSVIGTSVGITFSATDGDGSDTISYALSDDAGGLFTVDPETGEVTVAGALDYETATNHNITVIATSTDGTTSSQTFNIALTDDTSEFSATAITETDAAADTVSESAAIGDSVGVTFNSVDGDGTDSITFTLTDNAGGLFTIDPDSGKVTVAGALDYETATSHNITVQATSTDGSSTTHTMTINLIDNKGEFAVTGITDTDATNSVVSESVTVGTTVGLDLDATDSDGSDTVSYSLSNTAGGLFTIDPSSGIVTVAAALDYETATSHTITVVATSTDGSTSNQSYIISLTDDKSEFTA